MKPHMIRSDDDALLIEWIGTEERFGISLEKVLDESSWYYVRKDGHGVVISECGELSCDILNAIAGHIAVYHRKHVASAISTERPI